MGNGSYRTPVLFQRVSTNRDAAGQPVRTVTTLYTDGGNVRPVTGREAVDTGLETAESGLQVTVRNSPTGQSVTVNDCMVIRGKTYNITYAQPNFGDREILFVGRVER